MNASPTLPSLLSRVLLSLERVHAGVGFSGPGLPSLDLWANLLRALGDTGIDPRDLPALLSLSKRAVRTRVATAVRRGWIEESKPGRGQTSLRLTPSCSQAAARCRALIESAEHRWQAQAGHHRAVRLRAALQTIVAGFPLEHPHYPASYGPADASITGGGGQDWKPVPRGPGDTVSELPLFALVSQVIIAYAMSYEERSPVALSLSSSIVKRIPTAGLPVSELRNSVGVSALTRHGFLRLTGSSAAAQSAFLTAKGKAVSDAYDDRIQAVEAEWRDRFGSEAVSALRLALEDVAES